MEIIWLILEKVCEAIYFSLFMIYGKNIKKKKILFILTMILEYLMITTLFNYSIWIHILYIFMTYVNLKVFYKEKTQITDIFLFMIASIILIILSAFLGSFKIIFGINYYFLLIINRIFMFLILYLLRNKIYKFYKRFYTNWNRQNKPTKIRSLTLRNISIIIFNLMFYIINIGMIYGLIMKR